MHGVETVLNVLGSVALLLWGVRMVRTGLTRAFGAALRRAIAACSGNRFTAFLGGIAITGVLQSSTATALLVSSFAGRGLIPLSIAFAVMLGADIGKRDRLPYTKRFDEIVDAFNRTQPRAISPHLVWRLVATLAK